MRGRSWGIANYLASAAWCSMLYLVLCADGHDFECPKPPDYDESGHHWSLATYGRKIEIFSDLNNGGKFPLQDIEAIDIPIFVGNLAKRNDKRRHMEDLLSAVGFTSVSFPTTVMLKAEDEEVLRKGEWLTPSFYKIYAESVGKWPGYMPYVANSLTMLMWMEKAINMGLSRFGIFEDDLIIGLSPLETNAVIRRALRELPATADVLYLEACAELCDKLRPVPGAPHLLRLYTPFCTGAIIYTTKGARKVLQHALPMFDLLHGMLPHLMLKGELEAYLVNPTPFFQDAKWGSDALGIGEGPVVEPREDLLWTTFAGKGLHVSESPICEYREFDHMELHFELLSPGIVHLQGEEYVVNVRHLHVPGWAGVKHGTVHVFCINMDEAIGVYDFWGDDDVPGGIELRIASRSPCYSDAESAQWLKLVLVLEDWTENEGMEKGTGFEREVYKVVFLRPSAEQGQCGGAETSIDVSSDAHEESETKGLAVTVAGTSASFKQRVGGAPFGWPLGNEIGVDPVPSLPCGPSGIGKYSYPKNVPVEVSMIKKQPKNQTGPLERDQGRAILACEALFALGSSAKAIACCLEGNEMPPLKTCTDAISCSFAGTPQLEDGLRLKEDTTPHLHVRPQLCRPQVITVVTDVTVVQRHSTRYKR